MSNIREEMIIFALKVLPSVFLVSCIFGFVTPFGHEICRGVKFILS